MVTRYGSLTVDVLAFMSSPFFFSWWRAKPNSFSPEGVNGWFSGFWVVVSNGYDYGYGSSVQSDEAFLTVYGLPTTQPSSASVFIGQNPT
jgi:hypothetical protein